MLEDMLSSVSHFKESFTSKKHCQLLVKFDKSLKVKCFIYSGVGCQQICRTAMLDLTLKTKLV